MEAMPISKAIIAACDAVLGTSNRKDSKGRGSPEAQPGSQSPARFQSSSKVPLKRGGREEARALESCDITALCLGFPICETNTRIVVRLLVSQSQEHWAYAHSLSGSGEVLNRGPREAHTARESELTKLQKHLICTTLATKDDG